MSNIHKLLIKKLLREGGMVGSPVPGEAPSAMSGGAVLTEPQNNPDPNAGQMPMDPAAMQQQMPSLYDLYPDLMQIDPTDATSLAQYFTMVAQQQQQQAQMAQQTQMVPSYGAQGTPQEFA